MKFLSILTIFLVFVIVIVHAAPTAEKIGHNLKSLAVARNGIYASLLKKIKNVNKEYDEHIADFNKNLPIAAAADNLPVPASLKEWNDKYTEDVSTLKETSKKMDEKLKIAFAKAKFY
ncbi:hypothetical protein C1645_837585 [Glomus cerebriforme]|uniref:Uncharacterized protein n=1 Tax=Glomus cerebriforme TaxID=658196 RepID=A0A397S3S1_9GLOM|nr:hypothetical protein C1645_837585 [Glomus cerebriforme]